MGSFRSCSRVYQVHGFIVFQRRSKYFGRRIPAITVVQAFIWWLHILVIYRRGYDARKVIPLTLRSLPSRGFSFNSSNVSPRGVSPRKLGRTVLPRYTSRRCACTTVAKRICEYKCVYSSGADKHVSLVRYSIEAAIYIYRMGMNK